MVSTCAQIRGSVLKITFEILVGLALVLLSCPVYSAPLAVPDPFRQALEDRGFSPVQIGKVLKGAETRIPEKVGRICVWLEKLGVQDIPKILSSVPVLFDLDPETNLNGKIRMLKKYHFSPGNISLILNRYPRALTMDLERRLPNAIGWLLFHGVRHYKVVIVKHPQILGFDDINKLDSVVNWLHAMGFTRVAFMIKRYPPFLGLRLDENLKPTLDLLMDCLGFTIDEIQDSPMLLGASVERLDELCYWSRIAGVDLTGFSLSDRRHIAQNGNLTRVFRKLRSIWFAATKTESLKVSSSDFLTLLQDAGALRWAFQTYRDKISRPAMNLCIQALRHGSSHLKKP